MKTSRAVVFALMVIMSAVMLSGCFNAVRGSGKVEASSYQFSGFNQVQISGAFEFEIRRSDSYSVTVNADDNLFDYIKVSMDQNRLYIRTENISIIGTATLKAVITLPEITSINISGACRGAVTGFSSPHTGKIVVSGASSLELADMNTGQASVHVSGASRLTGNLNCTGLQLDVSGASMAEMKGGSGNLDAVISGASNINLREFGATGTDINISGASSAVINTSGTLNANISGASKLDYYGNPVLARVDVSTASKITAR